jgi:hypothetical protein
LQGQKWLNTRLSEDVKSLTATVTALELEGLSSPTTSEGLDFANNEDSSFEKIDGQEIGALDFNDVSHEKTDSAPFDWFDLSD